VAAIAAVSATCTHAQTYPGAHSLWNGYDRYDFTFNGQATYMILPHTAAAGNPWLMRASFADGLPGNYHSEVALGLLDRGYTVVDTDIINMMGCPDAVEKWNALYAEMTSTYGLASKVVVEGTSRGGLLAHNWAVANAESVSCILGYVPVCDIKSWPAGQSVVPGMTGLGNAYEWTQLKSLYGFSSDAEAMAYDHNPIDTLSVLADAGVRILHLAGSNDPHVPLAENSQIVYDRYLALGGEMQLIVVPGGDHAAWLTDVSPIVDFVTVPEPATLTLFGLIALGVSGLRNFNTH
jgi:pimeloyl-ACP methyl ester carboxylesterase